MTRGFPLINAGEALWGSLATIIVVWTGLRIAFSGSFHPWELIRAFIGLWIPWVILHFYETPIPGVGFSFPFMVSAGGNWVGSFFLSDIVDVMENQLRRLIKMYLTNITAAWADTSMWSLVQSGGPAAFTLLGVAVAMPLLIAALLLIFCT